MGIVRLAASLAGAIGVYMVWYRFQVGPFCPAMWHGTAPPVIMALAFGSLYQTSGRFWS